MSGSPLPLDPSQWKDTSLRKPTMPLRYGIGMYMYTSGEVLAVSDGTE